MKKFIVILIVAFSASFGSYGQLSSIFVQKSTKSEKSVKAEQSTECTEIGCFEGEIIYETFENYSEWIRKMANSVYVDGVHKMRLLVKGNKMHLIDETTKCHILVNDSYTHYCDITGTGFSMEHYDFLLVAAPRTLDYGYGQKAELTMNTFTMTDQKDSLIGRECTLWKGDVVHNMGGKLQTYSCHAYCSDIKAPSAYTVHLYGMPLKTIATKWIIKYDGGHESTMNVGELSFYMEGDITSINSRPVSDDEFELPESYKIKKGSLRTTMAMLDYYKGVKKALENAGIKGDSINAKSTGVHFKSQEEWDF